MKYTIISEFANAKITVETNDIRTACAEFLNRAEDADHTCVCDGTTGEVLANTGDDPYCTEEFGLILLGYIMADAWDEDDEIPATECSVPEDAVVSNDFLNELRMLAKDGNFLAQALLGLPS